MCLCRPFLLAFVAVACGLHSVAFCQEEELTPKQQWDQATKVYHEKLDAVKKSIVDQVTALEDKAREHGDADKVKKYKEEREAFEENGELPSSASEQYEYRTKLRSAQSELRQAFKKVQAAYLKAKIDVDAEELKNELDELIGDADTPAGPRPEGIPASGARWISTTYDSTISHAKGKKWIEVDNKNPGVVRWHLTETGHTGQYVELFYDERKYSVRAFADHMDIKKNGKWEWVANGHWLK